MLYVFKDEKQVLFFNSEKMFIFHLLYYFMVNLSNAIPG